MLDSFCGISLIFLLSSYDIICVVSFEMVLFLKIKKPPKVEKKQKKNETGRIK